jgi:hypothetical protein
VICLLNQLLNQSKKSYTNTLATITNHTLKYKKYGIR